MRPIWMLVVMDLDGAIGERSVDGGERYAQLTEVSVVGGFRVSVIGLLFRTRGDHPVTYKLFPGLSTDEFFNLYLDLETDLEREPLYCFKDEE
ncbi:hypothetical protein TB1_046208 [Malus domestica]